MKLSSPQTNYMTLLRCGVLLFISFCSFGQAPEKSDTIKFTVYYGSNKVGKLNAIMSVSGEQTTCHINSQVNVDILLTVTVVERTSDVFKGGSLVSSHHTRLVNGSKRANNTVSCTGQGCALVRKGETAGTVRSITNTIALMYHREPRHLASVFSQNFLASLVAKEIRPHEYELELPNGETSTFKYSNGKLVLVTSSVGWGTVRFQRDDVN